MSDPKRAHLITVSAPKSAKNNVMKTVRLTINLDESNESKYPELNYKELVIAEERKKRVENGKTKGLDPFSDNDADVERVARKFEQKYGGKSKYYGRKGRSKHDDFADIGAGYDENDSFIDNTHGYDEMIPPECDTLYGGFYINCGSLEFKTVVDNSVLSDAEPANSRRNKRRVSSSSSEEESSDSSSECESRDAKTVADNQHRNKNKKSDKKKAKKIRRTDSSAATSGKQTSDDNNHGDGDSADSRTSHSDSLTSKPAPSSENAITSDSSRDVDPKVELSLPTPVKQALEELEAAMKKHLSDHPNTSAGELGTHTDPHVTKLESTLQNTDTRLKRAVWTRAARVLRVSRTKLLQRVKTLVQKNDNNIPQPTTTASVIQPPINSTTSTTTTNSNKRKQIDDLDDFVIGQMTPVEKEEKILDILKKLKELIEERKPGMIASYDAECKRVQEERKKIMIASAADGAPHVERRLPKRRFPWCGRTRALLGRLTKLAPSPAAAATLLAHRVLPLFPPGFVRMPTLLRQADLSKEIKVTDMKRHRSSPTRAPIVQTPAAPPPQPFTEPIQFPSSLTVTTTVKTSLEKTETAVSTDDKDKTKNSNSVFGTIINSFSFNKDLLDKADKKETTKKENLYVPPNNIGSITITPVPVNHKQEKKNNNVTDKKEPLIRVKSPAALNEMAKKEKDKLKKDKEKVKEKRAPSPLQIDTSYHTNKKDQSPKANEAQKHIENMRLSENNLPRPALIPIHHSPTFVKPEKRPVEKKKKDVLIISDVDPLGDVQPEPVSIDDSSSDVEVIEDSKSDSKNDKRDLQSDKSVLVPLKDKVSVKDLVKTVDNVTNSAKDCNKECRKDKLDEATKEDIDTVMRNLREMEHSQDTAKFNSASYGGVITNAKHESSKKASFNSRNAIFGESRSGTDKLTNFFAQNGWM